MLSENMLLNEGTAYNKFHNILHRTDTKVQGMDTLQRANKKNMRYDVYMHVCV